jgi:hypothetical protein
VCLLAAMCYKDKSINNRNKQRQKLIQELTMSRVYKEVFYYVYAILIAYCIVLLVATDAH